MNSHRIACVTLVTSTDLAPAAKTSPVLTSSLEY